jgi:acyl carrier protein
MILPELKSVILQSLGLDDWDMSEATRASEVARWDSLHHVSVIMAVEKHFGVRFKGVEVLRLQNVGDLQRLLQAKLEEKTGAPPPGKRA